jgi:hypothetical protein
MDCLNDIRAGPSYGSLVGGFNSGQFAGAESLFVANGATIRSHVSSRGYWPWSHFSFFYKTAMAHVAQTNAH